MWCLTNIIHKVLDETPVHRCVCVCVWEGGRGGVLCVLLKVCGAMFCRILITGDHYFEQWP